MANTSRLRSSISKTTNSIYADTPIFCYNMKVWNDNALAKERKAFDNIKGEEWRISMKTKKNGKKIYIFVINPKTSTFNDLIILLRLMIDSITYYLNKLFSSLSHYFPDCNT